MAISYSDFNIDKVIFGDAETDPRGNINVSIKYERNGKTGPVTFNFPICRSDNNGVTSMSQDNGSVSHSVKILFPRKRPIFVEDYDEEGNEDGGHYEEPDTVKRYNKVPEDPNNPDSELVDDEEGGLVEFSNDYEEMNAYATIFDQIYRKGIDHCFANKARLKMADAKQRIMVEAQIKNPLYRRMNEDETEDMSYPPSVYFKFIESGANNVKAPNTVYTKFIGVDQKPINWRTLENTMMYLLPTVRIERIFLGAKKNFQCKLVSAVVTWTKPREEMSNDIKLAQDMLAQNPSLLRAFTNSLTNIQKYREVKREGDVAPKKQDQEMSEKDKDPVEAPNDQQVPSNPPSPSKSEGNTSALDAFMGRQQPITPTTPVKKIILAQRGATTNK